MVLARMLITDGPRVGTPCRPALSGSVLSLPATVAVVGIKDWRLLAEVAREDIPYPFFLQVDACDACQCRT